MPGLRRVNHTKIDPRTRRGLAMLAQNAELIFGEGISNDGEVSGISGSSTIITISLASPSGLVKSGGLAIDPKSSGGLAIDTDGVYIVLDTNPGLQLQTTGLSILLDTNPGLQLAAGGMSILLDTPAHGQHMTLAAGGLSIDDDYVFNTGDSITGKVTITTTTSPQLQVEYDGSNYFTLFATSGGDLEIDTSGGNVVFKQDIETDRWLDNDTNTFIGVGTISNGNLEHTTASTGWQNTAFGGNTLHAITTGYGNTALGYAALYTNTTGYYNVAVGMSTLYSNLGGYQNVGVGEQCLRSNTSGYQNVAMGFQALYLNQGGYANFALGTNTLYNNVSGISNVAVGNNALQYNTTSYNVAIGQSACYLTTSGPYNVAIGRQALHRNTTGQENVGIGYNANQYNQTGNYNVIIGTQAGQGTSLHNKSGNVFIGYQSGYNETGSNKLYIENSNSASPLIYGEFDNDIVIINGDLSADSLDIGSGTKHDGFIVTDSAEVQTTDATQTTLDSLTLEDENTYHVEAYIVGVQSDGTDRASYHIACTVYRTGAGGATLQGSVTALHSQESNASLDATFTVSGNDLLVSVTGIAAETWEWGCTLRYINMSN